MRLFGFGGCTIGLAMCLAGTSDAVRIVGLCMLLPSAYVWSVGMARRSVKVRAAKRARRGY